MYEYIRATFQSVFNPDSFLRNSKGKLIIEKYGWIFIIIRWSCYSFIFSFRDYHGNWKPFVPTPFGVDLDTYAFLQTCLSLPFGIFLMGTITLFLYWYLRFLRRKPSKVRIFNILGITFFLPFVIVQFIDIVVVYTIGWRIFIVTPIHTLILLWESVAGVNIISRIYNLTKVEKVFGVIWIMIVWLIICGILWR